MKCMLKYCGWMSGAQSWMSLSWQGCYDVKLRQTAVCAAQKLQGELSL